MKINKPSFKRIKNPGISLLISLGTSTLVLIGAMYTIISVKKSLENSENIERSTQLFFATESGIEAAFFHHNARGAGTTLTDPSQTIEHPSISITNTWELKGRTERQDDNSNYSLMSLLKEGQSIQIPLHWDASTKPTDIVTTGKLNSGDEIAFVFHEESSDLTTGESKDLFEIKYGAIPLINIDFNHVDTEVLVDWSFARTHSTEGIQTFSPTKNNDCQNIDLGFICEDQLNTDPEISSNISIDGRILPGNINTTLDNFFDCTDAGGGTCSDYMLTFRSLLQYKQSDSDEKITGIPFEIYTTNDKAFPKETYTVSSNVTLNNFSQTTELTVPERTAIGAFNYVIFD